MTNTLTYQQIASAIGNAKDLNIEQDRSPDMLQARHQGIMMAQAQLVIACIQADHDNSFNFHEFVNACKEEKELIVRLTVTTPRETKDTTP